jgi:hypothetical protein
MTAGAFDEPAVGVGDVIARALGLLRAERHRQRCCRCGRALVAAAVGGYDRHPPQTYCLPCSDAVDRARGTGAAA